MVTNEQGQTELQGTKELRNQLAQQIRELNASQDEASSSEGQQKRRIEIIKADIERKSQEANEVKDKLILQKSKVEAPLTDLTTFLNGTAKLLDFDPRRDRIDYTKTDMMLNILQDLDDRVNKLGTETAGLDMDLTAFDRLALDMQSLSVEAQGIAFQFQQVQTALRERKASADVSNQDSTDAVAKLKELQIGLKVTLEDLRKNLDTYRSLLRSIKENDVTTLVVEINRLKGAFEILTTLSNSEKDRELKAEYASIAGTIKDAATRLEGIQALLNGKITEANDIASEQYKILDNQGAIEARQSQIVAQFETMIQEQSTTIKYYNQNVKRIDGLLSQIGTLATAHTTASSDLMKIKGDLSSFQITFTQAMVRARDLLFKARINIATANLTRGWQNPFEGADVNFDGRVDPIDALLIVNAINGRAFPNSLPKESRPPEAPFVDADGDGTLSPLDVLVVVNFINARKLIEGD